MHLCKLLIVLIFLLFNSKSYAHYFSESFSNWNILGSDIIANFSILELEATRIFQVKEYEKMLIGNEQNEKDSSYEKMSNKFNRSLAFKTACDLIFKGKDQPSGYTEPLLHRNRHLKKN